jgi:hypothetical protein
VPRVAASFLTLSASIFPIFVFHAARANLFSSGCVAWSIVVTYGSFSALTS